MPKRRTLGCIQLCVLQPVKKQRNKNSNFVLRMAFSPCTNTTTARAECWFAMTWFTLVAATAASASPLSCCDELSPISADGGGPGADLWFCDLDLPNTCPKVIFGCRAAFLTVPSSCVVGVAGAGLPGILTLTMCRLALRLTPLQHTRAYRQGRTLLAMIRRMCPCTKLFNEKLIGPPRQTKKIRVDIFAVVCWEKIPPITHDNNVATCVFTYRERSSEGGAPSKCKLEHLQQPQHAEPNMIRYLLLLHMGLVWLRLSIYCTYILPAKYCATTK